MEFNRLKFKEQLTNDMNGYINDIIDKNNYTTKFNYYNSIKEYYINNDFNNLYIYQQSFFSVVAKNTVINENIRYIADFLKKFIDELFDSIETTQNSSIVNEFYLEMVSDTKNVLTERNNIFYENLKCMLYANSEFEEKANKFIDSFVISEYNRDNSLISNSINLINDKYYSNKEALLNYVNLNSISTILNSHYLFNMNEIINAFIVILNEVVSSNFLLLHENIKSNKINLCKNDFHIITEIVKEIISEFDTLINNFTSNLESTPEELSNILYKIDLGSDSNTVIDEYFNDICSNIAINNKSSNLKNYNSNKNNSFNEDIIYDFNITIADSLEDEELNLTNLDKAIISNLLINFKNICFDFINKKSDTLIEEIKKEFILSINNGIELLIDYKGSSVVCDEVIQDKYYDIVASNQKNNIK